MNNKERDVLDDLKHIRHTMASCAACQCVPLPAVWLGKYTHNYVINTHLASCVCAHYLNDFSQQFRNDVIESHDNGKCSRSCILRYEGFLMAS